MADPVRFQVVHGQSHYEISGYLTEQIKDIIYQYADRIPLALALGVLRIVESQILSEQEG